MADVKVKFSTATSFEINNFNEIYVDDSSKVANSSFKIDSNSKYQQQPHTETREVEGLSWANGYLVFNENGYLSNVDTRSGVLVSERNPQGFVWGTTDGSGYYEVTITFKKAIDLDSVVIYGNQVSNQFPTMAYVDNSSEPIYNSSVDWTIKFADVENEHSIRFVQWNRANYNAELNKIGIVAKYVELDKFNGLKSMETLSQTNGQRDSIHYGLIFNDGSVEAVDIGGEIEHLINKGSIESSDLPLEIFINGNQVQSHITNGSKYNNESKVFTMQMSNEDENLFRIVPITKANYNYNPQSSLMTYMRSLLMFANANKWVEFDATEKIQLALDLLNNEYVIDPITNERVSISTYANNAKFVNGTYYKGADSVKNNIDEICNILQLSFVQTADGTWKFISNRPVIYNDGNLDSKVIRVTKGACRTQLKYDLLNPIKYQNVKYSKSIRTNSIQQVYNRTFRLKDNDGNFTLAELGERASIRETSGAKWLNFFVDISSSYDAIVSDVTFAKDGVYPVTIILKKSNGSTSSGSIVALPNGGSSNENANKQNFDFTSMGATATRVPYYTTLNSEVVAINKSIDISDDFSNYDEITVQIQMRCYSKSEEDKQVNDNEKYVYDWSYSSTLLNSDLHYGEYGSIQDIIANTIVKDYKDGILVADIDIVCVDMYHLDGTLAKDWSKGETIDIQDILKFDDDNQARLWKVTGRRISYSGVPKLQLELQEVKLIEP